MAMLANRPIGRRLEDCAMKRSDEQCASRVRDEKMCANKKTALHERPFAVDVRDDHRTCECCDECTQDCREDI